MKSTVMKTPKRDYKGVSTMNVVTRFLLMCSGSSWSVLNRTPTEINKHVGLGGTIFFTGLLAALSGGYALWTVFENLWAAIGFGVVWGLMIFNLDRYIVTSMKKKGGFFKQFSLAFPRIVLAALIALVIAIPLELRIFKKEIDKELVVIQNEELQKNRMAVDSLFSMNTADIQGLIAEYKAEIASREDIYQQRQKEFDYERLGRLSDRTSGNEGYGPMAKEKELQMIEADEDRRESAALLQPKIEELEMELAELREEEEAKAALDGQTIAEYNGLAAQLQAFNRLKSKEPIIGMAGLFVMLLLLALETAPVFVKLMSPPGPYDDRLTNHEHIFEMNRKEQMADREHDFAMNEITRKRELHYHKHPKRPRPTNIYDGDKQMIV